MRDGKVKLAQADGPSSKHHTYLKRRKHRHERHKAKKNPNCVPTYGKYNGYEM